MKKTKHISYKIVFMMFFLPLLGFSQSKRERTETFDMDKNPELMLDVSHAEIIVTTWNKSKVEVKTILSSETLSEKEASELFDAHEVKVLGNSNRVEITSNAGQKERARSFMFAQTRTPPKPPRPNANSPRPPIPPMPPKAPFQFNFDYETFKEEGKAYLEKFKEQLDSTNFREEMKNFRSEMLKLREHLAVSKDSLLNYHIDLDSLRVYVRTFRTEARDMLDKLKEDSGSQNPKGSIKKVIEIKVPKSTTFEVNLRHSKLDADSMKNLSAKLRYSDIKLGELLGEESEIHMNYSSLFIDSAEQLSLNLVYSKKAEIGNVNELNVKSKMSELAVGKLRGQALIKGSYGKLSIDEIDPDFFLIDIQLEKSTANLKLPKSVDYRFYAKSSNSKFNINSDLEFKMSKSFEDVIYTSTASKGESQIVSLSANYSTVNLE